VDEGPFLEAERIGLLPKRRKELRPQSLTKKGCFDNEWSDVQYKFEGKQFN
jgi:hypothetical protein